jgi:tRNA(adenine34) deaminase
MIFKLLCGRKGNSEALGENHQGFHLRNEGTARNDRIAGGRAIFIMKQKDIFYMQEALKEAIKAFESDEVPVGAVIVYKEKIVARAHNQIKLLKDPTAHAEMIAITQAASYLGNERLLDTTMYVTLEPCSMCTGALVLARVKRVVFGAKDEKAGACGSVVDLAKNKKLNHKFIVKSGIYEDECRKLLQEFFKLKRKKK